MMKNKINFAKALKKEEILTGVVKLVENGKNYDGNGRLYVECDGRKVIIEDTEVVRFPYTTDIRPFLGQEISFVIKKINKFKDEIYGSHADAVYRLSEPLYGKLFSKQVFNGKIIHIVPYGVYVDIGGISGLLKNNAFTDDGTAVSDYYGLGDEIEVRYLRTSAKGTILFEPKERREGVSPIGFDDFKVGQTTCGSVVKIMDDKVFVNIIPGIDCLCPYPKNIPGLVEQDLVELTIIKVKPEEQRIRGAIYKCLGR